MAASFEEYQAAIQPEFQQGPYGTAWGNAFGLTKDQLMSRWKLGILARFPSFAPLDALGMISDERQILQGVYELTPSFIGRLLNAWGAWSVGGTYWGLLAQLAGAGYSNAYIATSAGWVYGPASGLVLPDPVNGIPGTPPSYVAPLPWYTTGSAASSSEWQSAHAYKLNSMVTPTTQPGTWFLAATSGTSGGSEPSWPGPGGQVNDNGITWVYAGNYVNLPVGAPWTFGNSDGQGATGTLALGASQSRVGLGGPAYPTGSFWSRFIVIFTPPPASWSDIVNPPTTTSAPSAAEIALIQQIIQNFKPGKSSCVGIFAEPTSRQTCWRTIGTTTNIPFSCWLARAIISGDVPTSTAFVATRPQSVGSWLPNTAITNAGGSTYMFTVPSSAYQVAHPGTNYLYSSPASSGTTGFTEPTWPTTISNTVSDNGITWTCCAKLESFGSDTGNGVVFLANSED